MFLFGVVFSFESSGICVTFVSWVARKKEQTGTGPGLAEDGGQETKHTKSGARP